MIPINRRTRDNNKTTQCTLFTREFHVKKMKGIVPRVVCTKRTKTDSLPIGRDAQQDDIKLSTSAPSAISPVSDSHLDEEISYQRQDETRLPNPHPNENQCHQPPFILQSAPCPPSHFVSRIGQPGFLTYMLPFHYYGQFQYPTTSTVQSFAPYNSTCNAYLPHNAYPQANSAWNTPPQSHATGMESNWQTSSTDLNDQENTIAIENQPIPCETMNKIARSLCLTNLSLVNCCLRDDALCLISGLKILESLNVSHNYITHKSLECIPDLKRLSFLDVSRNQIGDKGAKFISSSRSILTLRMDYCSITQHGIKSISAMTQLTSFSVNNNTIGKNGAQSLSELKRIERLEVENCSISNDGLECISTLENLTDLKISCNNISDEGFSNISSLPKLRNLSVSRNQVTDHGVLHLLLSTELESVDLRFNMVSHGAVAEQLSHLSCVLI